ncbi:NAD-dependent epimerase/dehydratase family protein [Lacinutrix sp. Bg11-31]|uniref:NAD-dependent epimerase/dehydratase family protein n=1 Tax=Lacinutrix sp. Bg11-31 TaxID=2057808 RepID=UPI000C304E88|nr:NAD-dependent epimerase/dehydratase family protein [Lacinutrix sp. Bg11-31]AUC82614.1 NAD-dependent epimerase [Lacinutrix sp. Bg11-31]
MILVTGGTGFVGAHLLFKLLEEKQAVRAIYRNEKKFDTVKRIFSYYTNDAETLFNTIDWVEADLNDIPALTEAFKDITHVYHCAAFVSFEPDKFDLLLKTNVEGTANIVNLSIAFNVIKLCYISSIAAIGEPKPGVATTEDTEWNPEADNSVYAITKYGAELEVWRSTQEGLDAVIVNPGVIIGPGIWNYGSGSIIKTVANGLKYYTKGSVGCVAVSDVVNTLFLLMQSDVKNERFIIVSNNWSYKKLLTICADALAVKPPKKEAESWLLQIGWRLDWLKHKVTGKRRVLTRQLADSLVSESLFNGDKIKAHVDFEYSNLETEIKEVCKLYLKEN